MQPNKTGQISEDYNNEYNHIFVLYTLCDDRGIITKQQLFTQIINQKLNRHLKFSNYED